MDNFKDNQIVHIDLTHKNVTYEEITREMRQLYIGGVGINAKLLFDSKAINADPLSEDNVLIFGVGPAVGSQLISGNRCTVTAKSPLSGCYGDANAGGNFNVYLRSNRIDHLVFTGKAKEPVYVFIEDENKIEIKDAQNLWGLGTDKVTDILLDKHGNDCEVACIGQAGEQMVLFASIVISGTHSAARTGMGCVMGSKKLKAIVVKKGRKIPSAYNSKKITKIRNSMRKYLNYSIVAKIKKEKGTLICVEMYNKPTTATLPCYNSQKMRSDEAETLLPKYFKYRHEMGRKSCHSCSIGCVKLYKIADGVHKGTKGERIDYGALLSLGPMLGIFKYNSILYFKKLLDVYGMDAIEFGCTLAMAMECYEKGILRKDHTDGIELTWGNSDAISELLEKTVKREGFGNILADGTSKAAQKIHAEQYAFAIKGVGTGLLTNNRKAWSLGYITAVRGGDHLKNQPFSMMYGIASKQVAAKIFNSKLACDLSSPEQKGRVVWWHENHKTIIDSLGFCVFATDAITTMGYLFFDDLAEIMNALIGLEMNAQDMLYAAERVYQLQNAFNVMNGICAANYDWPKRKKEEGIDETLIKSTTLDKSNHCMLKEYFDYRGLNSMSYPTQGRLKELGLEGFISKISKLGNEDAASIRSLLKTVNITVKYTKFERFIQKIKNTLFLKYFTYLFKKEEKEFRLMEKQM